MQKDHKYFQLSATYSRCGSRYKILANRVMISHVIRILTFQPQRAEVLLHTKKSIRCVPLPVRHAYIREQSDS